MNIFYSNGSYSKANKLRLEEVQEAMNGAVITAINEGYPFRGKPKDMAQDALSHLIKYLPKKTSLLPVIYESIGGINKDGYYTNEVVFQGVS